MADLICPKCGSDMRSYERNGITIDQCTNCRGVFLDRGELERLVDAEGAYYGREAPRYGRERDDDDEHRAREPFRHERDDDEEHRERGGHYGGRGRHRREREGFLGELFDFG